jgi:effector-binding domain-containing protein
MASMGFFDELKDFATTLRRLGGHWRFLLALTLLIGFGAFYLQKKFAQPPSATVATETPAGKSAPAEKAPPATPPGESKDAEKEAETPQPAEPLTSEAIDVVARPALAIKGEIKSEDAEKAIETALAKLAAAAAKAGLKQTGKPLAVFSESNESTVKYSAMLPIEKAPDAKTKFADGVEAATTPAGKALKFEHRGSYDDIDSTYEAIAAYLDEKGLEMNKVYVEEYLTTLTDAEDTTVDVDIYVFVK